MLTIKGGNDPSGNSYADLRLNPAIPIQSSVSPECTIQLVFKGKD